MNDPLPDSSAEALSKLLAAASDTVPGVGVDAEHHDRWRRGNLRLDALFTQRELAWSGATADPAVHLAGLWCAKEAALKAMSPFLTTSLRDIEILHDSVGRPVVHLTSKAIEAHQDRVRVSISHTTGISIAVAIYLPIET